MVYRIDNLCSSCRGIIFSNVFLWPILLTLYDRNLQLQNSTQGPFSSQCNARSVIYDLKMFIRLSACLQMFESSQKDSLLYICSNEMEVVKLKPHNSTVSLQAENTNLKGSITVQLTSSLTGLDLTKQLVKLLFIQPKQRRSVSHTEILPFKLMFFAQSER